MASIRVMFIVCW
ncbi:hypothetical protein LINGRAPRIM_LOCUS2374 [Linum grandiflorum]